MIDSTLLSSEEMGAVSAYRDIKGRSWKTALRLGWERSHYPGVDPSVSSVLQRMRNTRGPDWLAKYSPEKEAEKAHEAALTGPVIAEFSAMAVELGVPLAKSEAAGRQMFGSMAKAFDKAAKEHDRALRLIKSPVPARLKPELEVVAWLDAQPVDRRRGSVAMYARPYVTLYQDFEHESDLYVPVTKESTAILAKYPLQQKNATKFKSDIDGVMNYDVPFAYVPHWERKSEVKAKHIAGAKSSFADVDIAVDRKYEGNVLGVTDCHVVLSLGNSALIIRQADIDRVPASGEYMAVKFAGGKGFVEPVKAVGIER